METILNVGLLLVVVLVAINLPAIFRSQGASRHRDAQERLNRVREAAKERL